MEHGETLRAETAGLVHAAAESAARSRRSARSPRAIPAGRARRPVPDCPAGQVPIGNSQRPPAERVAELLDQVEARRPPRRSPPRSPSCRRRRRCTTRPSACAYVSSRTRIQLFRYTVWWSAGRGPPSFVEIGSACHPAEYRAARSSPGTLSRRSPSAGRPAPSAYVDGLLATDLVQVADLAADPGVLDRGGWWAVLATLRGRDHRLPVRLGVARRRCRRPVRPGAGRRPPGWRSSMDRARLPAGRAADPAVHRGRRRLSGQSLPVADRADRRRLGSVRAGPVARPPAIRRRTRACSTSATSGSSRPRPSCSWPGTAR